jgi:hypothetical protein
MQALKNLGIAAALALTVALSMTSTAKAGYYGYQYYGGWNYCSQGYYYCNYYYKPYYNYSGYCYNYCIYYSYQPQYCYYYSPYSGQYWGRYDLKNKGYSMLAQKDRASQLKDIPEAAFPKPGPMPEVPQSSDHVAMAEPPAFEMPATPAKTVTKTDSKDETHSAQLPTGETAIVASTSTRRNGR